MRCCQMGLSELIRLLRNQSQWLMWLSPHRTHSEPTRWPFSISVGGSLMVQEITWSYCSQLWSSWSLCGAPFARGPQSRRKKAQSRVSDAPPPPGWVYYSMNHKRAPSRRYRPPEKISMNVSSMFQIVPEARYRSIFMSPFPSFS